jgi:acetate kinase
MRDKGYGAAELERLLYHESGLLALSGETSDMRTLLASKSPSSAFAVDYYCYWAARHVGSLAVALGGVDAIAFTGGIGENAAYVRAEICSRIAFLGVKIDPDSNALNAFDLTEKSACACTYIVPANEEFVIARHAQRLAVSEKTEQSS